MIKYIQMALNSAQNLHKSHFGSKNRSKTNTNEGHHERKFI